jgi:peptidoglycan-associated lipoprotein
MVSLKKLRFLMLALVLGFTACSDDEEKVAEPVQPTAAAQPEPTPPPAPAPVAFKAEAVFFSYDDYTLNSDTQQRLQGLAQHLSANKAAVVQVEGHCDERGSIEYNLALGERRAQSVKNYLGQLGVEANRLSTISYGEEKPAVEGHDEASWAKNRRAEFSISNQ